MRLTVGLLLVAASFPFTAFAQVEAPPWPSISFSTCPPIAAPIVPGQLMWKHGQAEQAEFEAASKVQDQKESARLLLAFAAKYPDSDYHDLALILAIGVNVALKDVDGQVLAAKMLVESPSAEAAARVYAYVTLTADLSPYVFTTDPDKTRKVADLERWARCGMEALRAEVRPESLPLEVFEKNRQAPESMLDRTLGFVALQRGNYPTAVALLESAARLNTGDPLAYLWLSMAKLSGDKPELNEGVFYFARMAELSPQAPVISDSLKQVYVIVHGSDQGLSEVRRLAKTNTTPPPHFNVLRPPQEHHNYGSAIAAIAIVGLLTLETYEMVKHPDVAGGIALPNPQSPSKVMIFGGPGHRTYLGCLNCSEFAADSVFNKYGHNGSSYSPESIWNSYNQFGSHYSAFSACNPYASDPPVIVDQGGNPYGRLTVNTIFQQIGIGSRFYSWLASEVCRN